MSGYLGTGDPPADATLWIIEVTASADHEHVGLFVTLLDVGDGKAELGLVPLVRGTNVGAWTDREEAQRIADVVTAATGDTTELRILER